MKLIVNWRLKIQYQINDFNSLLLEIELPEMHRFEYNVTSFWLMDISEVVLTQKKTKSC